MRLQTLTTLSSAIVGALLMVIGNLIQSGFIFPSPYGGADIFQLSSTLQVFALLLTALVSGPRSASLAAIIYISLGLFQVPIFTMGGNCSYLFNPSFGYLAGFIPAGWFVGQCSRQNRMNDPLLFSLISIFGLIIVHACGIINIILGCLSFRWSEDLVQLIVEYSLGPFGAQLILCCAIGIVSIPLRKLLLIRS
uniref:Biotin transporter n=1 Tax=Paulinella micropora TaxID=1928728 RepID=A0A385HZU9_9EUKA|nr:hypothetical protein PMNZ_247 [Paulinella micropora]AXY63200.1 hypothetical protein PMNZ_247 [Paulinella micropora]